MLGTPVVGAALVTRDVQGDTKQPGLESGAALEIRQAPMHDDPDVLDGIVESVSSNPQVP